VLGKILGFSPFFVQNPFSVPRKEEMPIGWRKKEKNYSIALL
jgi:hypothetical protein